MIEEENEDALNEHHVEIMRIKYQNKIKGRMYIDIPYKKAQVLKKRFDLYWNTSMKKWMCLEKDYDDIMLVITERADGAKIEKNIPANVN